ncbi:MAG: hypothetical protein RR702_03465 [Clostridia bacterium]
MFEFWKNEWQLFVDDLKSVKNLFAKIFGESDEYLMLDSAVVAEEENNMFEAVNYQKDTVDANIETFFDENVEELRVNLSNEGTQHDALREYAKFFKPYNENVDMCHSAFKKYYDRHALELATNDFPVEQARIIQNNVDLFIQGQDIFGENGQFIDSRVDSIFEKVGMGEVNKMIDILHDGDGHDVNASGERTFAETISYMVDNGIKVEAGNSLVEPVKQVLENKLSDVHTSLRGHDDWNEEYQNLLSQERKYLYALNRIEQFETEKRIAEFEKKLNEIDSVLD